ncbi:hypothetical protein ACGF3K_14370 [Streptomyces sp. NPDC047980]|uniref:hypothetical protein n=1 Tax=Streptomyces sp. NPDC047980 TaxID=3365494 RepID=UPI00371DF542
MARGHGRILTSIWEDSDFLALDPQEQRLYLFLISQPNLNHAGLLPLTLRRWSRKARGLTSADLEKLLEALESTRFVVLDDDTEELLIRSFVRNDGVWRMPKVMGAMVSGALEISSKHLQRALLAEMDRIPLEELSDEPTKYRGEEGPSIRKQVALHIETLRKAFGSPTPDPTRRGSATPSDTPSGTPSDTPAEEGPKASTRGRAGASRAHSPAPAPTPAPNPSPVREGVVVAVGSEAEPTVPAEQQRPDGLHLIPDDFHLNDAMRRFAASTYPQLDPDFETQQFISYWRAEGRKKRNWHEAWRKWLGDSAKHASQKRPGNVIQLPNGQQLTGTDAKVAGWLALAEQLRQEGDPA